LTLLGAAVSTLQEMTEKATVLLLSSSSSNNNKNGFVLVVQGSQVDWFGHNKDAVSMATDFLAFDRAFGAAVDFAKHDDGNTFMLHIYTSVSVVDLVDPIKKMKMTANALVPQLPGNSRTKTLLLLRRARTGLKTVEPHNLFYSSRAGNSG
jgi:alkaline phosphatase